MIDRPQDKIRYANAALTKLAGGEPLLSLGIRNARTPEIVRIAKTAGFGVVWVDLEHSSMSIDTAAQILGSASDLGLEAWVRVPEREYGAIGRLLDGGATGVVAPRIETAQEARTIVEAARFPPRGRRSQIASLPQLGYRRVPASELNETADTLTTVHILLETAKGIGNADEIAAIDGVDMLHVGMNDLSVDMGHIGNFAHPDLVGACKHVIAAARRHGKLAVAGCADPAVNLELLRSGSVPILFAAIDTDLLALALNQRAKEFTERAREWQNSSRSTMAPLQ